MTEAEQEQALAQARELYATDPEAAMRLRREIATSSVSSAWSMANVDLAAHEFGRANYESALRHAEAVLAAPSSKVDPAARAVAGIILCDVRELLDREVDDQLLVDSIAAAEREDQPYYAGTGLNQRARLLELRGHRAESKAAIERAVSLFDRTESMVAAPGALLRLATMEAADGERDSALAHISAAEARLDRSQFAGTSGRVLREKLAKLRAQLG